MKIQQENSPHNIQLDYSWSLLCGSECIEETHKHKYNVVFVALTFIATTVILVSKRLVDVGSVVVHFSARDRGHLDTEVVHFVVLKRRDAELLL